MVKIFNEISLEALNTFTRGCMLEFLDIKFTKIGNNYLCATMPVTNKTRQPLGLLHGGASVALAESVGSTASAIAVDLKKYRVSGVEINSNHLRSKKEGIVTAKATVLHFGKMTHIWNIDITDEYNRLISVCRLTNMITAK